MRACVISTLGMQLVLQGSLLIAPGPISKSIGHKAPTYHMGCTLERECVHAAPKMRPATRREWVAECLNSDVHLLKWSVAEKTGCRASKACRCTGAQVITNQNRWPVGETLDGACLTD